MADKTFAIRLVGLRKAAGLTQAELADESGIPLGTLRGLEQARRQPTWAAVQALAAALKIDCREFEAQPKKRK
jgi:transcriptional regulator with XRE-family HTH domain